MENTERGRVLVVDDDLAVRMSLQTLLSDDFEVFSAADAADAETQLARLNIHVLISDYEMPGRTGLELLRQGIARNPGLVGLLLTGHATHKEVRAADRDQEIFSVVLKPFDPDEMIGRVKRAVQIAKLRETTTRMRSSSQPRLPKL